MRLEAREQTSAGWALAAPLLAVALTLLACAGLLVWAGAPVGRAYALLFDGAFGSRLALTETLTRATPLILTGLAVAVAFRARLYNIGAEGQLYLGALAAVAVGGLHGGSGWDLPPAVLYPLMLLAGMAAGAALLLGPAWLKLRFGVDEVVTTLLLNFIALLLVSMLLDGVMKDPLAMGWPQSVAIRDELVFAQLLERSRVHSGLLWALGAALALWALERYTRFGLAMRAVGANARAARFAGLPVKRVMLATAALSGALAGLAGVGEVAGRAGYVTLDMSPGYGYSGIVIAMLAQLHPLGVVLAALFVAGTLVGADSMSRALGVPSYLADVIVAVSLLAMLVTGLAARYRLRWS
ncbi:ABC transporter permease [Plasticicumulans acidivorans]|uniref:Nucleoside ABC transporter membrane protein n=1 Tax=Plasticicumulans acidivorans TaxID=886464 RepID=A0A317MWI7_9GAMM|nr:ABC transporter permease [Plasticicumulans acidivorans]PWV63110.1 nucleoside ABC transporter membrane protein [Plasticicumulans acidivorans]